MKRLVMALAVWGLIVGAAFSSETYSSKEYDFTFQYPTNWEKKERISGTAVTILAPKGEAKDGFRANVNVVVQDIPSSTDLKKFSDASLSVMDKLLAAYKEVEKSPENYSIESLKAVRTVFTYQHEGLFLKAILVLVVSGKHGYAITCTADAADFDNQKQAFDAVVNSFKTK